MMSEMFPPDLPAVVEPPVTGVWQGLHVHPAAVAAPAAVLVVEAVRQEAAPGVRLHELGLEVGHVGHGGGGDCVDPPTV